MSTLNTLLTSLREAEDGLIEIDLKEVLGSIKGKVDNTFEVLDRLESDSERMGKMAKAVQARKKSIDNQIKRLKDYVQFSMEEDGTTELLGETHKLKLYSRKGFKVKSQEVDSELFMKYPEVITREYSFQKTILKEKFKAEPEVYGDLMEPSESKHIRFTVK